MTQPLSPAAQAVLDAMCGAYDDNLRRLVAAAALRAAADRTEADSIWRGHPEHTGVRWAAGQWRTIAAELEGHHG
jgi:hypothetical protein